MKANRMRARPVEVRCKHELTVERLEDRLVPGESLSGLLFTPMGLSPLSGLISDQASAIYEPSSIAIVDTSEASSLDRFDATLAYESPALLSDYDAGILAAFVPSAIAASLWNSLSVGSLVGISDGGSLAGPSAPTVVHFAAGESSTALFSAVSAASTQSQHQALVDFSNPASGGGSQSLSAEMVGEMSAGGEFAEPNVFARLAPRPFGGPQPFLAFSGYTPAQIKHAYGVDQLSANGAGVTIAIVDAFQAPKITSDLNTFDAMNGLPAANLVIVQPQGKPRNNTGWAQEITLDVEWAHAMAPAAKIVLEEAKTNSFSNLFGAVNDAVVNQHAQIVSMSWGGGEFSTETSIDQTYFNKPGVTFIVSSGDTGGVVGYPSTSPYVLSAGGTSLPFDSSGNPVISQETTWSGAGGGPSAIEARPGYQTGFYSGSQRGTPDISSDSDPNTGVQVIYNGLLYIFGGTSVAAPTLAGEIALADQGRATPLSSTNLTSRTEYNAAAGTLYSQNYHDITTGSNGFAATTGYDLATGLGSPVANNLIPWLNTHS